MPEAFEPKKEYGIKDLISEVNEKMKKIQAFIDSNFSNNVDVNEGTDPEELRKILQEGVHVESICEAFWTKIQPAIKADENPKLQEVIDYFSDAYEVAHVFDLRVINYMGHHNIDLPF